MNSYEEFIKEESAKINENDILKVLRNMKKIVAKVEGPLKKFARHVKLLFQMLKDYVEGRYRRIPFWAICAIVFTLLYILNPLDFVPDPIPFTGMLDDLLVLTALLAMIKKEIKEYEKWKNSGKNSGSA